MRTARLCYFRARHRRRAFVRKEDLCPGVLLSVVDAFGQADVLFLKTRFFIEMPGSVVPGSCFERDHGKPPARSPLFGRGQQRAPDAATLDRAMGYQFADVSVPIARPVLLLGHADHARDLIV